MKLLLKITATQLKPGYHFYFGQEVKNRGIAPFAIVPYQGGTLKVDEGQWIVEYHDGTKEVWNSEQLAANTDFKNMDDVKAFEKINDKDEDVRPEDEFTKPLYEPEAKPEELK